MQDLSQAMVKLSCATDGTCGSVNNTLQGVSNRRRRSSVGWGCRSPRVCLEVELGIWFGSGLGIRARFSHTKDRSQRSE